MFFVQPSSGPCCSLQSIGLLTHPRAWALTLHPAPGSAPLIQASSLARLGDLETPDNKQLQPSHWPLPRLQRHLPTTKTNTLLSFQRFFFSSSPHHIPVPQFFFFFLFYLLLLLFFFFFFLTWSEKRKKNEGSDGSHFSSTFLFSLTSRFLALPPLPGPSLARVSASVCFSPMVERQPKCERDGCQSPFLSPKAPCLSSLLCLARLHLHIVI